MSQPIKYWAARTGGITAKKSDAINDISDNSALVAYSDYAALAAENERLREASFVTAVPSKEYESLKSQYEFMRGQAEKRFAEICKQDEYIEQLRLAGDAMYDAAVQDSTGLWVADAFDKWHKMNHPRTERDSK